MKQKMEKKYIVIVVMISIIFFLGIMSFFIEHQKKITGIDSFFKDSIYKIYSVI